MGGGLRRDGQKGHSPPTPFCLSVTFRRDSAWRPSPFARQIVMSRGQGLYMCLQREVYQAEMASLHGMEDPRLRCIPTVNFMLKN